MHNNPVTDQYKLVKTPPPIKAFPVFGRTIEAVKNYSAEIFEGDFHHGSVRSSHTGLINTPGNVAEKMRVQNGYMIYWIRLDPHPVSIAGYITTRDKYVRIYDITFEVAVSDPTRFIEVYRRSRDPLDIVIKEFKSSLQTYASQTDHDKLAVRKRYSDAGNDQLYADLGMSILQISVWNVRNDPKREALESILQEAKKNMLSMQKQAEIQEQKEIFDRKRQAEQNAFDREQQVLDHMYQIQGRLRETAAQEVTEILRERIRGTFERGKPIGEVAEDSMKLLNAFHEALYRGSVVDSTLSGGPGAGANGASAQGSASGDPLTDPSFQTPPNLADLARTRGKEERDK